MTQRNTPMKYEQLKQSHDEWRMLAMHNYGASKAAEVREQQLKKALEILVLMFRFDSEEGRAYMTFGDFEEVLEPDDQEAYTSASNLLSALYPDTPAPKEGE